MTTARTGLWVEPENDPRTTGQEPVGEKETVWEYLCRYRMTLVMKCEGLDAEQLARRSVPPSTLSLLGIVRHLANVEHHWFQRVLTGSNVPGPFTAPGVEDLDFDGAVPTDACVTEAWGEWHQAVEASDDVFWSEQMDREVTYGDGAVEARDVLLHMVEEYARHMGHVDLLRERIDGRTGL